jgi:hypothetical protein
MGSMPGKRPPVALLVRGRPRLEIGIAGRSARTFLNPSSINEVNVRPSASAFFLARRKRSSGR